MKVPRRRLLLHSAAAGAMTTGVAVVVGQLLAGLNPALIFGFQAATLMILVRLAAPIVIRINRGAG